VLQEGYFSTQEAQIGRKKPKNTRKKEAVSRRLWAHFFLVSIRSKPSWHSQLPQLLLEVGIVSLMPFPFFYQDNRHFIQ